MDRLLQFLLRRFIQRGTFKVTTPRGRTFTCGDGTGKPVSVRFTTQAAELGILLDPELKFGEAYMDGTLVVEQGSDSRRKCQTGRGHNGCCDTLGGASLNSIPAGGRAATSPITMTSTAVSTRSFWMPTGNTAAAISKRWTHRSTMRKSRRNVTLQPS